jgi:hypothetical protein
MIIEEIKSIKSTKKDLRSFGITVGTAFVILSGILFYFEKSIYSLFLILGTSLIASGIIFPVILKPLQKLWMILAVVMGFIMTRIILMFLFFIVFMPIGLISRAFGKQFLEMKWDKSQNSYWNIREKRPFEKSQCESQF